MLLILELGTQPTESPQPSQTNKGPSSQGAGEKPRRGEEVYGGTGANAVPAGVLRWSGPDPWNMTARIQSLEETNEALRGELRQAHGKIAAKFVTGDAELNKEAKADPHKVILDEKEKWQQLAMAMKKALGRRGENVVISNIPHQIERLVDDHKRLEGDYESQGTMLSEAVREKATGGEAGLQMLLNELGRLTGLASGDGWTITNVLTSFKFIAESERENTGLMECFNSFREQIRSIVMAASDPAQLKPTGIKDLDEMLASLLKDRRAAAGK